MSFDMEQAKRNLANTMQNSLNQVQGQQPQPRQPQQPNPGMGQAPPPPQQPRQPVYSQGPGDYATPQVQPGFGMGQGPGSMQASSGQQSAYGLGPAKGIPAPTTGIGQYGQQPPQTFGTAMPQQSFGTAMPPQQHPAIDAFHQMIDHPHGQSILQARGWTPPAQQAPQAPQQMQQPKTPAMPNPGLPTRR